MHYLKIVEVTDRNGMHYVITTPTYSVKMSAREWAKFKTAAIEERLQKKFETLEK